jgi:hypothetical protein
MTNNKKNTLKKPEWKANQSIVVQTELTRDSDGDGKKIGKRSN